MEIMPRMSFRPLRDSVAFTPQVVMRLIIFNSNMGGFPVAMVI